MHEQPEHVYRKFTVLMDSELNIAKMLSHFYTPNHTGILCAYIHVF